MLLLLVFYEGTEGQRSEGLCPRLTHASEDYIARWPNMRGGPCLSLPAVVKEHRHGLQRKLQQCQS